LLDEYRNTIQVDEIPVDIHAFDPDPLNEDVLNLITWSNRDILRIKIDLRAPLHFRWRAHSSEINPD